MYTAVIQELSLYKQIDSFHQLGHLRMINHRYIKQAIIRNGIRSLPISGSIAHTYGHHLTSYLVCIDFYIHKIFHPLEYQKYEREHKRQRSRAENMVCLPTEIHYRSYQSHIHAIQEIAVAVLILRVLISYATEVYLANPSCNQRVDGLFNLMFVEVPEMSEVVHHSVWNHTERNTIAHPFLNEHQTVYGIIKSRVATHDNDSLITIVYHHHNKAFYAACTLALNEIELHTTIAQYFFYPLPTLVRVLHKTISRTIEYAPFRVCLSCHISSLFICQFHYSHHLIVYRLACVEPMNVKASAFHSPKPRHLPLGKLMYRDF